MKLPEKSKMVFDWLRANTTDEVTTDYIAEQMQIEKRVVTPCITALAKRDLVSKRKDNIVTKPDEKVKAVTYVTLTQAGVDYVDGEEE